MSTRDDADGVSYLWDGTGPVDPEVAELETRVGFLRRSRHAAGLPSLPDQGDLRARSRRRMRVAAMIVFLVGATGGGSAWLWGVGGNHAAWEVISDSGSGTGAATTSLRVGKWLQTGVDAGAELRVPSLGRVTVKAESRVRLVRSAMSEKRIELARGTIEAFITAPPRVFLVDTPTARAVDLGCWYTLSVEADGSTGLRVRGGMVELHAGRDESRVPAGAVCVATRAGLGVPRFEDAPETLVTELGRFENGDESGLDRMLAAARPRDAMTLWHLVGRVSPANRERVMRGLAALVPAPDGLAVPEGTVQPELMNAWWEAVARQW
ncbi:MAG: FecR domain-containing protein [Phycisphaerae bacterium]|nr:FecR domain-containing protein [Phycisphaerae bacterium]